MNHFHLYCLAGCVLAAAAGCQTQSALMPPPNLYRFEGDAVFENVPPNLRTTTARVIYATDRLPAAEDPSSARGQRWYGHARSDVLRFGVVEVDLAPELDWHGLVEESVDGYLPPNPVPEVASVEEVDAYSRILREPLGSGLLDDPVGQAQLQELVQEYMDVAEPNEAIVYIHGYNSRFENAARTIAELWHFTGRHGVPMVYSWPAGFGGLRGYTVDRESGEYTVFHLKQFLRALGSCEGLERVHILAHSRGTDVLLTALRELHLENGRDPARTRQSLKLHNLILAAPDVDFEVFAQRISAEGVLLVPERFTLYISSEDRALSLASWLFSSVRRLGLLRPADLDIAGRRLLQHVASLHVIDARVTRTDFLGHSYFYNNGAVSSDVVLILRDDRDPGKQNGRPLVREEDVFWVIEEDYLLDVQEAPAGTSAESK